MKTAKWNRVPTAKEIEAFDGLHCRRTYQWAVTNNWHYPCCHRTAVELIRWSEIRGPSFRARYADEYGMGFTISITLHHCHGDGRFNETLICGDCNSADGAVKRKFNLPATWSFAPDEIKQFIRMTPHSGKTIIDYAKAYEIALAAGALVLSNYEDFAL
jgi:hypothetical protein